MSGHRSLVAFTLLVQSAIGGIWCIGVSLLLGASSFLSDWYLSVALLLVVAGLALSTGHLGRPCVCFYAIRSFRRSWVSREIVGTGALAAALAVTVAARLLSGSLSGWFIPVLCLVGGLTLYGMAGAYQLRTVPSWNHSGTLFAFLGSALVLGGLQVSLVSSAVTMVSGDGHVTAGLYVSSYPGLLVALFGLAVKAGDRSVRYRQTAKPGGSSVDLSRPALWSGIACWVISIIYRESGGLRSITLLLAAILLVAGEIRQRTSFYDSYRSAGL
jgi:DMSO reductase anchor subunit